ncbi:hypothetical protein BaRGS_00011932 [Batillaria attramentaria]|uniref:MD-2-related lipid-recognition domain-containing protein n=1 Tax=Batillaria attramentaria TaxID=370345 RepID=A0ABD0LBL7_9CAEN
MGLIVVVALLAMLSTSLAVSTTAATTALLSGFTWSDCGDANATFHVHSLDVTSPLTIPGEVKVSVVASLTSQLPSDTVLTFRIYTNSSFGPTYARLLPCIGNQGSCAYKLCDLLTLTDQSSSVTRQLVTALGGGGLDLTQCPPGASNVTLSDVTITIPDMLQSPIDSFINTNNYFVTATLLSPDGHQKYGCVQMDMPVHKTCLGWLCPKSIDYVIKLMEQK